MKDEVIDVQAKVIGSYPQPKPKPKFLTGTPGWMDGPWGVVYGLAMIGFAIAALVRWLF